MSAGYGPRMVLEIMSIFISSSPLHYEVTMVSYFHFIKFEDVKNLVIHE